VQDALKALATKGLDAILPPNPFKGELIAQETSAPDWPGGASRGSGSHRRVPAFGRHELCQQGGTILNYSNQSMTNLAYVALIATPAGIFAILAFLGSSFASEALPFVVGATLGYGLGYFLARSWAPRWIQSVAVFVASVAVVAVCLILISTFVSFEGLEWMRGPDEWWDTILGRFAGGFIFLFFIETLRRRAFSSFFANTPGQAREQRAEQVRSISFLGAILLALAALIALVFGILALIAHAASLLSG
jgi:hypothetical protein